MKMRAIPCWKQFLVYLISPFLILSTVVPTLCQPMDYNAMTNGKVFSGKKVGGYSTDIDLVKLK